MSYAITERAKAVLDQKVIFPNVVLEIEGVDTLIGSALILEVARFDDEDLVFDLPGLVFDGSIAIQDQEDLISLAGSTTQITQQLIQDDGAASSTTSFTVALVNKDNVFGTLITPDGNNDLISKKCTISLGALGLSFPEDYIRIFVGNITEVSLQAGLIKLKISHPENKKRVELFQNIQTDLTSAINNSVTTIPVISTDGMLLPGDLLQTYVRIDDEIIRYTGLTATTLTGCTRAQLGTTAAAHDDEAEVSTFYKLGDGTSDSNAITMALKILLSGSGFWLEKPASTFGVNDDPFFANSIFVPNFKLETSFNVIAGDLVTVTGATTPGNNVTAEVIESILETEQGTYLVISTALTPEVDASATVAIKSQYDTLTDGLALEPDQVDIPEFQKVMDLFGSSIPNYEFYLKDTILGKDLLNKEILFPAACYSIPRKGQISLGKTKPPIAEFETKVLNDDTVLNPKGLSIERSSLENFYNAVVFKFDEDALEDKFLSGRVTISANSNNRIRVGNKAYRVESKGIRKTADNETVIENNAQRILDRFQFGAETIKGIQVSFSVGWNIEVGDTVVVENLQLIDSKTGQTNLDPRIMEVTNRAFNFKTGVISLDVTDTAFAVDGRYGGLSPSTVIGSGSTSTQLVMTKSFGTGEFEKERDKWADYVGQKIFVHSEDFSVSAHTTLNGFLGGNDNIMVVEALAFTPTAGYIIDIAQYQEATAFQKALHCFFDPQAILVSTSIDDVSFEVADPTPFYVGSTVLVHSPDYSSTSFERTVVDITGDVVTVNESLGYTPQIDDEVELIGFVDDEGSPYRIL